MISTSEYVDSSCRFDRTHDLYLSSSTYYNLKMELMCFRTNNSNCFSFIQNMSCLHSSVTWGQALCAATMSVTSRRISSKCYSIMATFFLRPQHIIVKV